MPRHWTPEQQVLIREPGVAGTEWGAVFQEHVRGKETSPRRPQTHRPTSVNAAHGVTLLSWRKWQNINSRFHHFPNPFSLIPGPSAQRDLGPQTKCLSLIHLSLLCSSLFFNLMRGCGETCQCDNNYRNSPAATGPGPQNIHTHNCEVMEKAPKKKKAATVSRPSHRQWILGYFNKTTVENQITVVMTGYPYNSDNVMLSHTGHQINTTPTDGIERGILAAESLAGPGVCVKN